MVARFGHTKKGPACEHAGPPIIRASVERLERQAKPDLRRPRIDGRVDQIELRPVDEIEVRHRVRVQDVEQVEHPRELHAAEREALVDTERQQMDVVVPRVIEVVREEGDVAGIRQLRGDDTREKIGRASCRERV